MIPIAFSTLDIDPDGAVVIFTNPSRTNLGEFSRRVQRTATLDGNVVLTDSGFTNADRTVRIDLSDQTNTIQEILRRMVTFYSKILVFLPDGAYTACPERYVLNGSVSTMTLLLSGTGEVKK